MIKPEKKIVSYLTPVSGLRPELLKRHLPKDAILVGQNSGHDIEWMGLTKGTDFQDSVDTSEVSI